MIGTVFNSVMIMLGSLVGNFFKKGIKGEYQTILLEAMGLAVVTLGLHTSLDHLAHSHFPLLFIISLAVGGLLGQKLQLEKRFTSLVGGFAQGNLAEGLATAILLSCMGSLSIIGPIQAALKKDYTLLLTNGMLDGITAIVLASTFGLGIAMTGVVLFGWQGLIYCSALWLKTAINADMINELSIVGGILIFASGLSLLEIKKCHTLNLLPALFLPPVILGIIALFH